MFIRNTYIELIKPKSNDNSGEDPIAAHNRYPELWAQINREFVDEWKSSCVGKQKEDPEEALVFFMRAGFRDSPKWAMLFWEGDQMVSWQANDGIKSAVVGLLSSGISGYALNHSDIGGYCAVNMPLIKYHRSEELLLRWMEFSAFTTVFRTHEVCLFLQFLIKTCLKIHQLIHVVIIMLIRCIFKCAC